MTLDFHSGNLKAEAATSAGFSEKGGKQGRLTGQVSKQISCRLLGLLSEREGTWNQWRRSRRKSPIFLHGQALKKRQAQLGRGHTRF